MTTQHVDVLIIGSGVAGLTLALSIQPPLRVALISKADLSDGASRYAQGGIAAVMSAVEADQQAHIQDTLATGAGLCDPEVVAMTVHGAKAAIEFLEARGVAFTREPETAAYHLTQEGGHSQRRIVHVADHTGAHIIDTLIAQVHERKNITVYTKTTALDLIVTEQGCQGALLLNPVTGAPYPFLATHTALATGGNSGLYQHRTTAEIQSGDGIAMGYRAGASVAHMAFIQFHPTALYAPLHPAFLVSEAVRGEGGRLTLPSGEAFMARYDARAELAPRDIVSRAIAHTMQQHQIPYVHLDITHEPKEKLMRLFPSIYAACLARGIDMSTMPIPVVPAAHYTIGGLATDIHGRTDLPGLYALGETACTGLHGANRIASNSLLECVVFARRAAEHIEATAVDRAINSPENLRAYPEAQKHSGQASAPAPLDEARVAEAIEKIQRTLSEQVGIVKTKRGLQAALITLDAIAQEVGSDPATLPHTPLSACYRNLLLNAQLVIQDALRQQRNCGTHYLIPEPSAQAQ